MYGVAPAELPADINPAEQRVIAFARALLFSEIHMPQWLHLCCTSGEGFDPRRNKSLAIRLSRLPLSAGSRILMTTGRVALIVFLLLRDNYCKFCSTLGRFFLQAG